MSELFLPKGKRKKMNNSTVKLNKYSEYKEYNLCCNVSYKVPDMCSCGRDYKDDKAAWRISFYDFFNYLILSTVAMWNIPLVYLSHHIIMPSRFSSLCLSVQNYGCVCVCAVCDCVNPLWKTTFLHRKAVVVVGVVEVGGGDSLEGLPVRPCKPQWMSLISQAPHEDAQPIKLTVRGPLTSHRD